MSTKKKPGGEAGSAEQKCSQILATGWKPYWEREPDICGRIAHWTIPHTAYKNGKQFLCTRHAKIRGIGRCTKIESPTRPAK